MPDSNECRNNITSEDYADFIIEYNTSQREFLQRYKDSCPQVVGTRYGIVYEKLENVLPIRVQEYSYRAVPKLYGEMDTEAVEATGSVRLQNVPGLNLRGQGVIIGVIDSGIDFTHPAFRYSSGQSRIVSIWDQTDETGNVPEYLNYGTEYTTEDINRALSGDNPFDIVRSRDETGHGTFLAGVAAGSESVENDFIGAAPEAMIAVVKLKQAKQYLRDYYFVDSDVIAYQENDIMAGIRYLEILASKNNRPLVICLGVGTNQGAHSGDSYLETVINELSGNTGRCVVVPTGNEGNARHHYQGTANEAVEQNVEIRVDRSFVMELWGNAPDLLSIAIISPTGEVVPRIPARIGRSDVLTFLFESTVIYVDYRIVEQRSGAQLIFMRFENPTTGIWKIQVLGENLITGIFHMWLPITAFVGENTYFLNPEPNVTLTSPSPAARAVVTGGYNSLNGTFFIESGRGFTRSTTIKPDIVSPSVNVYGPSLNGGYQMRTGTSVGAALTTGAAAQLFQWGIINGNQTDMNSVDMKNFLIRGAQRSRDITYPDRQWGWGKVDVYTALDILR